jgi:hypothetical protein
VYELLLEAAGQAGDDRGRAIDLARAVETACRFPEAFETEVPRERLLGLFDDAVAAGPVGDPEVAACVAVARAWLAGPDRGHRTSRSCRPPSPPLGRPRIRY